MDRYLRAYAYASASDARAQLAALIDFYNMHRPHSSLAKKIPTSFYCATLPATPQAA